jgi:hypothetical protein
MVTPEPRTANTKLTIKVAGGQTIRSVLPASAPAPATILTSSPCEAASPFIFQFPATSGIILAAAIEKSLSACGYQTRPGNARVPDDETILVQLQGVGSIPMVRPLPMS